MNKIYENKEIIENKFLDHLKLKNTEDLFILICPMSKKRLNFLPENDDGACDQLDGSTCWTCLKPLTVCHPWYRCSYFQQTFL